MASADEDMTVYIAWTETNEYTYEEDFSEMAKTLGIKAAKLKKILAGDEELDLSELTPTAMKRLRSAADHVNEELTVDDVTES